MTVESNWFWFWFWFYYALWLASVFTLVLVLRQSSENRSNKVPVKRGLTVHGVRQRGLNSAVPVSLMDSEKSEKSHFTHLLMRNNEVNRGTQRQLSENI